jgi:hypothetical protein
MDNREFNIFLSCLWCLYTSIFTLTVSICPIDPRDRIQSYHIYIGITIIVLVLKLLYTVIGFLCENYLNELLTRDLENEGGDLEKGRVEVEVEGVRLRARKVCVPRRERIHEYDPNVSMSANADWNSHRCANRRY